MSEYADKLAKAKLVMKEINKKQGETVLDFADTEGTWERVSTGIPGLDNMIGGGFPYGHTSIVWGGAGAGKSTLMYSTVAQAQKAGKIVAFLDLENSFDNDRATKMGVNTKEMIIGHYDIAEKALDTIIAFAREGVVDIVILDSIHSMAPKGAVEDKKGEKSLDTNTMGLLARKLSEFFARATTHIFKANISLIMIGQTRKGLGGFVVLDELTGGNALIHNSVLTLHQRRGQKSNAPYLEWKEAFIDPDGKFHLQKQKQQDGFECVVKTDKKKCSGGENEGASISLPYYYDTGFIVPNEGEEVIKIDPKMNEEQVKIIKEKLVEKGYKQFSKNIPITEEDAENILDAVIQYANHIEEIDPDNNCAKEVVQELEEVVENEKMFDEIADKMDVTVEEPKKKKRGRPKKEKS